MRTSQVVVAGRTVRSRVVGEPRAGTPELVVVPGLGAQGYLLPTVGSCAGWTRVHLLDLPGFGHRSTSHLPSDLVSVSRVLAAWLDDVPTAPVLLVGHSTGAQVALRAALERPGRLTGLVLAGATFPPPARRPRVVAARVVRTMAHERPGELPAVLPYYLRGALGLPVLLRSALADRSEETVGRLRPPLHVLHGEHDRLCPPAWATALARTARDGTAHLLPGAHNTPYTHPRETSAALAAAARAAGPCLRGTGS